MSTISANSHELDRIMGVLSDKIKSADLDSVNGLSKNELASIDAGNDASAEEFLKTLTEQFDEIDKDGNGQLSKDEITNSKAAMSLGPPAGLQIASTESSDTSNSGNDNSAKKESKNIFENISSLLGKNSSFIANKLSSAYSSGAFQNLLSSFHLPI